MYLVPSVVTSRMQLCHSAKFAKYTLIENNPLYLYGMWYVSGMVLCDMWCVVCAGDDVLQDLVMDILRVLSSPDLEVRKKTLSLVLDLISSRNVEEVRVHFVHLFIPPSLSLSPSLPPSLPPSLFSPMWYQVYTEQVDIFSFGMFMYELLSLHIPYETLTTHQANQANESGTRPPLSRKVQYRYMTLYTVYII